MAQSLAGARIGFIGGGAMGEALVAGVLAADVPAANVQVADPDPARRKLVEESHGVSAVVDGADLVEASDIVVIAVKPGLVATVLAGIARRGEAATRPLWVSIAAGISLDAMSRELPAGARIVRGMPNTPALVGAGAAGFVANAACRDGTSL